jgi:hypothetical protein
MIEIAVDEKVLKPFKKRSIIHEYGEPLETQVQVYALEEIVPEKLRAILQHIEKLQVKQDFYARVFMLNLTSMLAFPVQDHIDTNHKDCKYSYQIRLTQALAKMKNVGILLFSRETIAPITVKLQKLFLWSVVPIRLGRKFLRKSRFYQRRFAFAYKPIS